jgi:hypothetical protein
MIHFREVQVLEGQMLQALDGFRGREFAGFHGFQKFQQFKLVHDLRPTRILSLHGTIPLT